MKFIVTQMPLNTVEVRLHQDTKDKIQKIALVGYWAACGTAAVLLFNNMKNKKDATED